MFIKSYRSIKILLTVSKIYSGGSQFPSLFLVRPPDFSPVFISSSPSEYPAKKESPVTNKKHVYENVVLLLASNILMTYAWYGHLKNMQHKPLVQAVLVSWGVAFFEYAIQVPANRIGYQTFSLGQLKIMQEIITMIVFAGFAVWYMDKPLSWNYLYAGLCMVGAAFFIFRDSL